VAGAAPIPIFMPFAYGRECARMPSSITRFVDRFVPPGIATAGPEVEHRVRLAIGIAWLMVPVFATLAVIHLASRDLWQTALNLTLMLVMAGGPPLLRRTGRHQVVINMVLGACLLAIIGLIVRARGPGLNPATVALAELPLFATLLTGLRVGAIWTAVSASVGIAVGVIASLRSVPDRLPVETRVFDEHASLVVITGTLFLVAAIYEIRTRHSLARIRELDEHRRQAERQRLEALTLAKLARAERLASMGRVAAATSHEINNPLTYVINNIAMVKEELSDPEQIEALADALAGAERIRDIVRESRGFLRADDQRVGPVDVVAAIRSALRIAAGVTLPRTQVETELAPVPPVLANESHLVQVVLNLVVNASEALPEPTTAQNRIVVRARAEGAQVIIEVEDNAPAAAGPAPESSALGLALVDELVHRHGGTLAVASTPGRTVATVSLQATDAAQASAPTPPRAPESAGRRRRVLVIDDEPAVAQVLQRILHEHHVTLANGGQAGLDLLARDRDWDVILCDLMMPDVSGIALHAALMECSPELCPRVIFMTGGVFTERAEAFVAEIANPCLSKPIDPDELRALVAG
jgi:signal transduction histidine kinase